MLRSPRIGFAFCDREGSCGQQLCRQVMPFYDVDVAHHTHENIDLENLGTEPKAPNCRPCPRFVLGTCVDDQGRCVEVSCDSPVGGG